MAMKPKGDRSPIEINLPQFSWMSVTIRGTTPLLLNRLPEKAQRQLLLPGKPKNAAEKASTLKHDPLTEYRDAGYRALGGPTLFLFPSGGIKQCLIAAATDLPGAHKSQMGRLTRVPGEFTPVYGKPTMFMRAVRSADMKRTPDIRTRIKLDEWVARFEIGFIADMIPAQQVVNLLAASGMLVGIGDGRQQKGAMDFGCFEVVDENDETALRWMAEGGRDVQQAAWENPEPSDDLTAELYSWFQTERDARFGAAAAKKAARAAKEAA